MADEYIDKIEVGAKIQVMCIRREMDYGGENDFCRGMRKALRVIENMPAADVQPVDRWISCKDKMPEDNTLVLFVYVSKNGVKSVHYGYHQTLKGLGSSWAKPSGGWHYYDDDITHWQPLPEPPKDGDTNG